MARSTASRQRSIALKYKRRVSKLDAADRKLRSKVRSLLILGLKQATEVQLYARTPLPVTKKMLRSVFTKSDRNSVSVGYRGAVAPYNSIRLAKTGRSKLGGHDMEMKPGEFIREIYGPKISREGAGALHDVIGD